MNKVQTKVIILSIVLSVIIGLGSIYFTSANQKSVQALFKSRQEEKEALFDNLLKLKSASLLSYAYDYTYWDEMVKVVEEGDEKIAKENIDTSLATYGANAVWVYRPDFSLVYFVGDEKVGSSKKVSLETNDLEKAFGAGLFPHFYIKTGAGLMELAGAPIQPTSDTERKTTPRGFFLTGRLWDKGYLDELAGFMFGQVEQTSTDDKDGHLTESSLKDGVIFFERQLNGFDGKPVDSIHVEATTPTTTLLSQTTNNHMYYQVLSSIFAVFLAMFFLARWIIYPLIRVSRSLAEGDTKFIASLTKKRDEFGQVAQLIVKFFEQKVLLEKEVAEHFRAEKEMQRQKDELERINKTMIDRELKMIELKERIADLESNLKEEK